MITFTADTFMLWATGMMFVSLRIFGMFLSMPLFAFRAFPMRLRLMVALLIAVTVLPGVVDQARGFGLAPPTFVTAAIELLIGVFIGFLIRLGLMAVELAAEVLSVQTGLSFATSYVRDPNIASGLMGELLGLTSIALMFMLNIHLLLLELVVQSFRALPFGQWPDAWTMQAVVGLISRAFQLGLVLSMPSIVVYLLFYVIQAILARTSPQFNLFSVGFAITVPLAFLVLLILLPDLPRFLTRALEAPFGLIRQGLLP
jgi:flagellar biosynthetic protein FliR